MTDTGDIYGGGARGYLVCGFFTPDYRIWAEQLAGDLAGLDIPFDLAERPKLPGGWSVNTRQKAPAILAAMDAHPDSTIIWLDVDCRVLGDLQPLMLQPGDLGVYFTGRFSKTARRTRTGFRAQLHPWSGTLLIHPTPAARRLIERWQALNALATPADADETTLALAIGTTPDVTVRMLAHQWCSSPSRRCPDAVIEHASAHSAAAPVTLRSRARQLRRRLIAAAVGQPYEIWKYGPRGKASDDLSAPDGWLPERKSPGASK